MATVGPTRIALAVVAAQLRDRPLRLLVTVVAIALGVALTSGVYFVTTSAIGEFSAAARALAGSADLIVDGGRGGFDERLYPSLAAHPGVEVASPVLELDLALEAGGTLTVIGVDGFVAGRVQPALYAELVGRFFELLEPRAIALSATAARALGVSPGGRIRGRVGDELVDLKVVAVLPEAAYGRALGVMDLGSAQWTLGRLGRLNRIELRLSPGVEPARFAAGLALPAGVHALTPAASEGRAATLTRAYRVNLNMLALVALLTGAVLVYATQAQSTQRRRGTFALLRALGVCRSEVALAVLLEGAGVGLAGGALGVVLGWLIAAAALARLGGDLGAGLLAGARFGVEATPVAKGVFVLLGVGVSIAGAWLPAHRIARLAPALALKGGDPLPEEPHRPGVRLGGALACLGVLVAFGPPVGGLPLAGYAAIALMLAAAILLVPAFAAGVLGAWRGQRGALLRLALAQLKGSIDQSAASLAAIVVSFSLMVAMVIMVHSFRDSFERWLVEVLPADVYLRIAGGSDTVTVGAREAAAVAALPGVERSEFRRLVQVTLAAGQPPVALIARPLGAEALGRLPWIERRDLVTDLPVVYVSEAVRDLYRVGIGARTVLPIAGVGRTVVVGGIWRDYARSAGAIVIDRDLYVRWSGDAAANEGSVWTRPGYGAEQVAAAIGERLGLGASLQILATPALKARSLAAFDRAFAITYALEAIAVGIGLAGVAFAFASQALARRAEFGMLRHLGCSRRELRRLLAGEGLLVGGLGASYGLLVGGALSLVLVYVVNRQSFHWSLDLAVPVATLAAAASALVLAASVTAVVAARSALAGSAVRAVREDW